MECGAPKTGRRGSLSRLGLSFRCAFEGLAVGWRTQQNLRIHLAFVLAITGLGAYLRLATIQWAILALTYSLVLTTELVNTALEALTDLVSPSHHPLARDAKDLAAGAVLVTAIGAVVVGLLVLGPPLWARLQGLWRPRS